MRTSNKIFLSLFALCLLAISPAKAKTANNMFNHFSLGLSTGTDGLVGFHAAVPIGNYVQMRMGYSFMPVFSYTTDVTVKRENKPDSRTDIKGKLHMGDFNWLFDIYPTTKSSFHFTAGCYIGKEKVVTVANDGPIGGIDESDYGVAGIAIGDYLITTDPQGNAEASIKVKSFKPYLGVGFGRAVPKKRVGVMCDLGVQFWGKPGVYAHDYLKGDVKVTSQDIGEKDGGAIKTISKISVFPVISLKVFGRIL